MKLPGYISIHEQRIEGNRLSMDIKINRWHPGFWFALASHIGYKPIWAMPFVWPCVIWVVLTKWDEALDNAASRLVNKSILGYDLHCRIAARG